MMQTYRPDKFKTTYDTMQGEALWKFLNEASTIAIMETASYLRRPAIEPLSPFLQHRFPKVRRSAQMRRMIGHMVRQILEERGFGLYRSNLRINNPSNIFAFGSAYYQPESAL
ncbi:hypothetical protein [Neptunicoccus cionae]|uniref:hypothetical protein n=1 Tax=Neptunicoccus cionae TaxID=2035344 RepID=UPI0011AE6B8F|nr:hypothetical protein [Amylibacter cionae]